MTEELTTKLSFRLNSTVYVALSKCAKGLWLRNAGLHSEGAVEAAVESGYVSPDDAKKVSKTEELIELAVEQLKALREQGLFTQDFVLTVFQHLMTDKNSAPSMKKRSAGMPMHPAYRVNLR